MNSFFSVQAAASLSPLSVFFSLLPFPLLLPLLLLLMLRLLNSSSTRATHPHVLLLAEQRTQRRQARDGVHVGARRGRELPRPLLPREAGVAAARSSRSVPPPPPRGRKSAPRGRRLRNGSRRRPRRPRRRRPGFVFRLFLLNEFSVRGRGREVKSDRGCSHRLSLSPLPGLLYSLSLSLSLSPEPARRRGEVLTSSKSSRGSVTGSMTCAHDQDRGDVFSSDCFSSMIFSSDF